MSDANKSDADKSNKSKRRGWLAITSIVLLLLSLLGCASDDEDTATTDTTIDATTGTDESLEGVMSISDFVESIIAIGDLDILGFCNAYNTAQELGQSEAAFEAFAEGFQDGAKDFGFTPREVYNEIVTRC